MKASVLSKRALSEGFVFPGQEDTSSDSHNQVYATPKLSLEDVIHTLSLAVRGGRLKKETTEGSAPSVKLTISSPADRLDSLTNLPKRPKNAPAMCSFPDIYIFSLIHASGSPPFLILPLRVPQRRRGNDTRTCHLNL